MEVEENKDIANENTEKHKYTKLILTLKIIVAIVVVFILGLYVWGLYLYQSLLNK